MNILLYIQPIIMPVVSHTSGEDGFSLESPHDVIMQTLMFVGLLVTFAGIFVGICDMVRDRDDGDRGLFISLIGVLILGLSFVYLLAYPIIKIIL